MQKSNGLTLVVAAVIHRAGNEILIVRRGPGMNGTGAWEFPGGKVESGETEIEALHREILEELGIRIQVGPFLGENIHAYVSRKIHLRFYSVAMPADASIVLSEHDALQWQKPQDMDVESLSEADRPLVKTLCQLFP